MSMKQPYPPECPAFEIVSRHDDFAARPGDAHAFIVGTHVVCAPMLDYGEPSAWPLLGSGGERAEDTTCCPGSQYLALRHVKPLTRAAREMLALVTPCK